MVDKDKILQTLKHYFYYKGDVDIDDNGLVNIMGKATLISTYQLSKLPVKFGTVSQTFTISDNSLTTLEGCPQVVGRFDCGNNQLTSLEHGPHTVTGSYMCDKNKLLNLIGAPAEISGTFQFSYNPLTSLEGLPENSGQQRLFLSCSYLPSLPLLRLCLVTNKEVAFYSNDLNMARKDKLEEVFNSPEAQGPAGVLHVASILHELSQDHRRIYTFEGNAEF